MTVDILTKTLSRVKFEKFRSMYRKYGFHTFPNEIHYFHMKFRCLSVRCKGTDKKYN